MFYMYHFSAKTGTGEAVLISEEERTDLDDFSEEWDLTSTQQIDANLKSGFPSGYLLHRE